MGYGAQFYPTHVFWLTCHVVIQISNVCGRHGSCTNSGKCKCEAGLTGRHCAKDTSSFCDAKTWSARSAQVMKSCVKSSCGAIPPAPPPCRGSFIATHSIVDACCGPGYKYCSSPKAQSTGLPDKCDDKCAGVFESVFSQCNTQIHKGSMGFSASKAKMFDDFEKLCLSAHHQHRRMQAGGTCPIPKTCPSDACASELVEFVQDCKSQLHTMGKTPMLTLTAASKQCQRRLDRHKTATGSESELPILAIQLCTQHSLYDSQQRTPMTNLTGGGGVVLLESLAKQAARRAPSLRSLAPAGERSAPIW